MSFHDVRLPTSIELGAVGGPNFLTTITTLSGGAEQRNVNWEDERAEYDIGYSVRTNADFAAVAAFFRARRGRAYGFRFKDHNDYTLTDENIGTGDDVTAAYQIIKTYEPSGPLPYVREIRKPVSGSVVVKVAGVTKTVTTHYTIDHATGIITFTAGNIPTAGQAVTVTCEFDVPVRFDVDKLDIARPTPALAGASGIRLVEIRT